MIDGQEQVAPELPEWLRRTFSEFLDRRERMSSVLRLSTTGIALIQHRPNAIRVLAGVDKSADIDALSIDDDTRKNLAQAEIDRDLAQRELNSGFPFLFEQATIALWGSLEALIKAVIAGWLYNNSASLQIEPVNKLRIRIGDYESLEGQERCFWVVDLLDQEMNAPLKSGVNRFETLLQPFGLSGKVDKEIADQIYYLAQVRNLIAHRAGKVDRKFKLACPWSELEIGSKLDVTMKDYRLFDVAVTQYVTELIQRSREHFGMRRY
jgi:hypothetical protein